MEALACTILGCDTALELSRVHQVMTVEMDPAPPSAASWVLGILHIGEDRVLAALPRLAGGRELTRGERLHRFALLCTRAVGDRVGIPVEAVHGIVELSAPEPGSSHHLDQNGRAWSLLPGSVIDQMLAEVEL